MTVRALVALVALSLALPAGAATIQGRVVHAESGEAPAGIVGSPPGEA